MASPRYLIGQGEKLSEEIYRPPRGMGDKAHPYSFVEARRRLAPQWKATAKAIESLPDLACPGGEATLEVTLHPSYLAKSYYPSELIRELGLQHLGIAMRTGAGVRAQFSEPLWAPAVKALLVHHANGDEANRIETGWGFVSHGLGDLVLCDDYEAHIVYQRQMPTTGAVRLYLPVPDGLTGNVEIKATFCFYCEVDPEDAINYTRAGLDIQFRPDTTNIPAPYFKGTKLITPTLSTSDSFFSAKNFYASEHMQRDDAQKWETTLSRSKTKRATSLKQPAFDVSYVAREHGHGGRRSANMKFALALTIRNRSAKDLYNRVIVSSGDRLQPMRPRTGVQVPIRLPK